MPPVGRSLAVVLATWLLSGIAGAHDPVGTVTWERDIAPIVQARCVACHREGGRASMPLTTFEEARPWARAIREEVLARRMPRWPIVRGYGDFTNDPSLSASEIALVVAWVDGASPQRLPRASGSRAALPLASAGRAVFSAPPASRVLDLPCAAGAAPSGTLVGVSPTLAAGASIRVDVLFADGRRDPILWLTRFDPAFRDTYWLRNPLTLSTGDALLMETDDPKTCALSAHFALTD